MGKLKNFVYSFLYYSGLVYVFAAIADSLLGRRVRMLYGHNVRAEDMEAHGVFKQMGFMHVRDFEAKIKFLKEHCKPLTVHETVKAVSSGNIPARAVTVTFDDGYRDKLTRFVPILEKYGVPATMYLSSGFMNEKHLFWFNRLIECICRTSNGSDAEKAELIGTTARHLKTLPDAEKHKALDEMERKANYRPSEHKRLLPMLTWEEVKKMAASPMITIGAHTITHPILTKMADADAFHEITRGRDEIFENTDIRTTHFAYPNGRSGDYNRAIRDHIEKSGFASAAATEGGGNPAGQDLYQLKRYGFDEESLPVFALKMLGFFDLLHGLKDILLDRLLSPVLIRKADPKDKTVYLTFDDGPHPEFTAPILDALNNSNVKATFFVSGAEVARFPDIARRIAADGHELASHSWAHERWSHADLPSLWGDVARAEEAIAGAGGPKRPTYRPPYGRLTIALLVMSILRGMKIILWSIDSDDDRSDSVETVLAKGREAGAGDILLFHDDNEATAKALPALIAEMRGRGLSFACSRDIKWDKR